MALEKDRFFQVIEAQGDALTFADVSIETCLSDVGEHEIDLTAHFTRNVELKVPFVSAAMDTVTESKMAIGMALLGGIGVIHAAFDAEAQKDEVQKVKYELSSVVQKPWTFGPEATLTSIVRALEDKGKTFRSVLVTDSEEYLLGILTQDHFDLAKHRSDIVTAADAMKPAAELITGTPSTTRDEAYALMQEHNIKRVPLLEDGKVAGLYVWRDIDRYLSGDDARYNVDEFGRLRVAVAIPTGDEGLKRIETIGDYADAYVIDSSTGDKKYARETLRRAKEMTDVDIMIGNISNGESVGALLDDGADGIKVGQGPGSICTTQVVLGYGKPQLSAVHEVALAARSCGVPVCADGGISQYGHISKAIAAGADSVMMGRMLAGTDESAAPLYQGKKYLRGMGSKKAMAESAAAKDRYDGIGKKNPLPQGIESLIPLEGPLDRKIDEIEQALRGSMSGCNRATIKEHQLLTRFVRRTQNAVVEAQPHDVEVIATLTTTER